MVQYYGMLLFVDTNTMNILLPVPTRIRIMTVSLQRYFVGVECVKMSFLLFCMVLILTVMNYTYSQFITAGVNNGHHKPVKNKCDNASNSALVEHFFNIIFSEFHNTPPGCVCVQMCPDQPTYCYPNGCFKKADVNKKPEAALPVARISENTKPIFFLHDKTDFINDFLDKNYVDENVPLVPAPLKHESKISINLRPDPFKDRYKIQFKYKKLPKVELKYNHGEQVKNMKSDVLKKENVDVSQTRWPMNKAKAHFNGHRVHSDAQGGSDTKFFKSMLLDKEVANYPPKYFKRELANNTNEGDDGLDFKAIYVVGDSAPANATYSLESLINNLMRNSFETNKTSNLVSNNDTTVKNKTSNNIFKEKDTTKKENVTMKQVKNENIPNNETTRIISMNFSNENVDKNKYTKTNTENRTNKFSEMIASLSKKIDMQNNTSLEMMRRMTGDIDIETPATENPQATQKIVRETIQIVTTENIISSIDYDRRTTKKIRQRLARRLQNSKNN